MHATRLGYRVHLNASWEESNHDWDGFHQLPHLACHQRGGLRNTALRPQLLRDIWILVICSKVAVGWVGAWIGSPVIRHWPARIPGLHYGDVWFIPAILGAAGVLIVAVDLGMMARATRA